MWPLSGKISANIKQLAYLYLGVFVWILKMLAESKLYFDTTDNFTYKYQSLNISSLNTINFIYKCLHQNTYCWMLNIVVVSVGIDETFGLIVESVINLYFPIFILVHWLSYVILYWYPKHCLGPNVLMPHR